MATKNKKWYQSWTIWFNVALLAVGFVNELALIIPLPAELLTMVASAGNILLRFKTVASIK